jgi:hypothetical protein
MNPNAAYSPVLLSYAAALRGVKPRSPGEIFTLVDARCANPDYFVCLAASNPEGKFFALTADSALQTQGEVLAKARGVENVKFMRISIADLLAQLKAGTGPVTHVNYLCCDEGTAPLNAHERAALFDLAEKLLIPGGLFSYKYRAYSREDDALRFIVREFAPEMNGDQAVEYLQELKALGGFFFSVHPELATKLEKARTSKMADEFFNLFDDGEARSGTFDTIAALQPRGFAYAGDSDIPANYVELAVPPQAQEVILSCRNNPLYEPIKDFALNRLVRSDIWCRQPSVSASDAPTLFGGFTYGVTLSREQVPSEVRAQGKLIDLKAPVYKKLIDLMTLMPISIGDFLAHPTGKDFAAKDVVGAIQIMIACGIARPMRGIYGGDNLSDIAKPRLVGNFNQYLENTSLTGIDIRLASAIVGDPVTLSARDALVMQALDRVGLANSVSALLPELERLAASPALGARAMDVATPTPEAARNMIEDVLSKSIVQWYAYGLLKAA